MVWIDYAIIIVIAISALMSIFKGFIREALSLVTWLAAFFVASQFYPYLASYFTGIEDKMLRNGAAIAALFVVTLIVGGLVGYVFGVLVKTTGLSSTDKILGLCFGGLRGILIVSALLFFLDTFTPLSGTQEWRDSLLIPKFTFIIEWFFTYLQSNSSFLDSVNPQSYLG